MSIGDFLWGLFRRSQDDVPARYEDMTAPYWWLGCVNEGQQLSPGPAAVCKACGHQFGWRDPVWKAPGDCDHPCDSVELTPTAREYLQTTAVLVQMTFGPQLLMSIPPGSDHIEMYVRQ